MKLAAFALCAYVAILLAAYFGQRRLMYLPDRTRTPPAEIGLADVLERTLVTTDGAKIILVRQAPTRQPDAALLPRQRRQPRHARRTACVAS